MFQFKKKSIKFLETVFKFLKIKFFKFLKFYLPQSVVDRSLAH